MSNDARREIDVRLGHVNATVPLESLLTYDQLPVEINGVFYWDACKSSEMWVLSLDVSNGVLDETSFPVDFFEVDGTWFRLIKLEEEVSLISCSSDGHLHIWGLDGDRSSFTKKLIIEVASNIASPPQCWEVEDAVDGKVLIKDYSEYDVKLLSYDLHSGETNVLPVFVYGDRSTQFYFYMESPHSVENSNEAAAAD